MSDFLDVLHSRTSVEHFYSTGQVSHLEVTELIEETMQAPSAFNIQHWRFIAVTDLSLREKLRATTLTTNQARLIEAPVTIMVLGDLDGHKQLSEILNESVNADLLSRDIAKLWLNVASEMYGSDPRLARDEAIRSCSLASMVLMLAAVNRGYDTCSVGFNPVAVKEVLGVGDRFLPVMMITVGRSSSGKSARRPRLPVDQVLAFNGSHQFS